MGRKGWVGPCRGTHIGRRIIDRVGLQYLVAEAVKQGNVAQERSPGQNVVDRVNPRVTECEAADVNLMK